MPAHQTTPEFRWLKFDELTTTELYEILRVRQEVFTVEQDCAYQDADARDPHAWHLVCWDSAAETPSALAYLRVIGPGDKYPEASIGRVLTRSHVRGTGLGRELMRHGISHTRAQFANSPIRISAQLYLQDFYQQLGFNTVSAPYDEDGIPHIEMLLTSL